MARIFEEMHASGRVALEEYVQRATDEVIPRYPNAEPIEPRQLALEFSDGLAKRGILPHRHMTRGWFAGFIRARLTGSDPDSAMVDGEQEFMPRHWFGKVESDIPNHPVWLEIANTCYDGQASMLYAVASTGDLTRGTMGSQYSSIEEWEADLW